MQSDCSGVGCQQWCCLSVFPAFHRGRTEGVASDSLGDHRAAPAPQWFPRLLCLVHEVMRGGKGAGPVCTCGETEAQWQQNTGGEKLMLRVSYLKHDVATRSFFGASLKPAVNKLPDLQFCSVSFSLDCNGFLWHTEAIQRSVSCFSYTTKEHSFSPWSPGSCHYSSVCSRNQAHAADDFGVNSPSIGRAFLLIRGFCVLFEKK